MVANTILEPVRKLMSVGMRRMHSSQGEGMNLVSFHRLLLSCIEANMESKVTSHRTRHSRVKGMNPTLARSTMLGSIDVLVINQGEGAAPWLQT